jgi:hypothetical protein
MAFTPSATKSGSFIRHAPNAPRCTLAQFGSQGQVLRLAAAQLQSNRVFFWVKTQMALHITVL